MLNTKTSRSIQQRRGWCRSATYIESGDAWPRPCWNSKSSASSVTNGANNDSADDQTIGTTVSSQTVKRSNLSFLKMQQQQQQQKKQRSKKSPTATTGTAATFLYPSIRDFVDDQFRIMSFQRMLTDHDLLTRNARALVQEDVLLTNEEIVRQVQEAYAKQDVAAPRVPPPQQQQPQVPFRPAPHAPEDPAPQHPDAVKHRLRLQM